MHDHLSVSLLHHDMKFKTTLGLVVGLAFNVSANAAIVLLIEGANGSANFSITGSGSNTVTSPVSSISTAFLRIPTAGNWQNPLSSTFGDILLGTPQFNDLIATSGQVVLGVSGSTSYSRSHNGLRILSSLPDQFALTTLSSFLPDLISGDVVGLSGTANFTFSGGATFDSVWNPGVYNVTPTPNGGSYSVVIRRAAVIPEPGTYYLVTLGLLGMAAAARRGKA